jgi:endonuclease/exonuclease/phosphatase family metal-dependent hydrolase
MPGALMMLAAALSASGGPIYPTAPADLSVMSYNVHGLPWPLSSGRPRALRKIGQRLAQMRETASQPHIVLLQEAFTSEAKSIAREANYPFVVRGPAKEDRFANEDGSKERQFARMDNRLKGEGDGKLEDSGLLILSDYPLVDVQRVPYARFACAGYDCLANKGLVMVKVLVPGASQPVTLIDTHMNSRGASGVSNDRADAAYGWQAEQLRSFVSGNVSPIAPAILAGDFNIGRTPYRRAMITYGSGVLPGSSDALRLALSEIPQFADRTAAQAIVSHGKDWMFARSGNSTTLTLRGVTVPFGREPNGKTLSDHFGYIAHYTVANAAHRA